MLTHVLQYINWRMILSSRLGFLQLVSILFFLALMLGVLALLDSLQAKKKLKNKNQNQR